MNKLFRKTEKLLYVYPDISDHENDFIDRLKESIDKFSDSDRLIIDMKYFEKMTHEEIAEELDIDPKTVTRRKNRIIKRLSFMLFPDEAIEELKNE